MATPDRIPRPDGDAERAQLVEAMLALVADRGLAETTIELVAERAGLAPAAFFRHFEDVPAGFLAGWDKLAGDYLRRVRSAYEGAGSGGGGAWAGALRAALYETLDCVAEQPDLARLLCLEVLNAGEIGRGRRDALLQSLAELVDAGRAELEHPDSIPESTALGIVGAAYSRTCAALRRPEAVDLGGLAPELMCFAVMPYLGVEAGLAELKGHES